MRKLGVIASDEGYYMSMIDRWSYSSSYVAIYALAHISHVVHLRETREGRRCLTYLNPPLFASFRPL